MIVVAGSLLVSGVSMCLCPNTLSGWHGWQVLSVQREIQKMQKEFDEGPTDDETAVTWTFEVVIKCHRSRNEGFVWPSFRSLSIRHGLPVARGYLLALL